MIVQHNTAKWRLLSVCSAPNLFTFLVKHDHSYLPPRERPQVLNSFHSLYWILEASSSKHIPWNATRGQPQNSEERYPQIDHLEDIQVITPGMTKPQECQTQSHQKHYTWDCVHTSSFSISCMAAQLLILRSALYPHTSQMLEKMHSCFLITNTHLLKVKNIRFFFICALRAIVLTQLSIFS